MEQCLTMLPIQGGPHIIIYHEYQTANRG